MDITPKWRNRRQTYLVRDAKHGPGPQQRRHDRVLRVRVDAAPRVAQVERIPKQRRARGLFQILRGPAQEHAVGVG